MPKFDVVVGNPPYKRNLHLKILNNICKFLSPNGVVIWLQPARWAQDPLSIYKKNSDFNKNKYLPFIEFELIPIEKAQKIFNNFIMTDLIISFLRNGESSVLNENKIYELRNIMPSFKKILNKKFTSILDVVEKNKRSGIRIRIKSIAPTNARGNSLSVSDYMYAKTEEIIIDGKINREEWVSYYQRNQYSKNIGDPIPLSIKFDSIKEAQNYINYTNTKFFIFLLFLYKLDANVPLKYLPWLDFTQEWTDEKLYKYFNLNQEEIKCIEEKYIKIL